MGKEWKRVLSAALAFVMILSMMPNVVYAEVTYDVNVSGLKVTTSDLLKVSNTRVTSDVETNTKPSIVWDAGVRTLEGVATGYTAVLPKQVAKKITLTNASGDNATLTFDYTFTETADGGRVEGAINCEMNTSSSFKADLAAGESVTITLVSPKGDLCTNRLMLTNIALTGAAQADATVTFTYAEGGSYTVNETDVTEENPYTATAAPNTAYALKATAAEGYQFFGWYNETKGAYVSYLAVDELRVGEDQKIHPVFIPSEKAVFGVGVEKFYDLSEADARATAGSVKTIVLLNNGTISGQHTVSAGNTLLIPYDDANTVHTTATDIGVHTNEDGSKSVNPWVTPTAYRTLTMAENAKITVYGSLNVGGKHSPGPWLTAGSPSGEVGMICMTAGSNITVGDGGALYCWGYIYGGGTVTAKGGAMIHENIQFADFRGGNATAGIAMTYLVFPMTQYYVQNIEVATTFEYGAIENVWGSIYLGTNSTVYGTSVQFIGSDKNLAMFVPGENGTVTKTYLPAEDRLQIDVEGDGSINPMTLVMEGSPFDSDNPLNTATFILPITNNMTINIKSGTTTLNQSLALLPGVKLTIAKDATLSLATGDVLRDKDTNEPVFYTGGHNLIVYDRDQWFNGFTEEMEPIETYYVYNGKRIQPVAHSPSWSDTRHVRTEADLVDAVLDINGTLIADGFIYTTVGVEYNEETETEEIIGGASIISQEGTGKIVMQGGAGQDYATMQATQNGSDPVFVYLFMLSARLQNGDGSYLDTMEAAAGATYGYCKKCNNWYAVTEEPHTVEITWIVDGEDNGTQEFCVGTQPVYNNGTAPEKSGYEFIGWSSTVDGEVLESLPVATVDATYYACFKQATTGGLKGDIDLDGDVDMDDLTYFAEHIAKIITITNAQSLANAEVTGDGEVTMDDLTKLAEYIAKIIPSLD